VITLPSDIDSKNIKVKYDNGILKITIKKLEELQNRKILKIE
jgi:HSP20 family molecular chaperone IbpA